VIERKKTQYNIKTLVEIQGHNN